MIISGERGTFWWGRSELSPLTKMPDIVSQGQFSIDDKGIGHLELDGTLVTDAPTRDAIALSRLNDDELIVGRLINSSKTVFMVSLQNGGGFHSSWNISTEKYLSYFCGTSHFVISEAILHPLRVTRLSLDLTCLRDWFGFGHINTIRSPDGVSVTAPLPENLNYRLSDANVEIIRELSYPADGVHNEISLAMHYRIEVSFDEPLSTTAFVREYIALTDLLKLLLDTDFNPGRPSGCLQGSDAIFELYFYHQMADAEVPKFHEYGIRFGSIQNDFGNIYQKWRDGLRQYGQGYYLYLGTKRGLPLYSEHRFINFIWQLEALHRSKFAQEANPKLVAKLARITEAISQAISCKLASAKDKKWLDNKLAYSAEPSLEDRLGDIFTPLQYHFETSRFRTFCKRCADRRNEISHFGGARNPTQSADFLTDLNKLSAALGTLTHAILLLDIGVNLELINKWLLTGYNSFRNRHALVDAGLIEERLAFPEIEAAKLAHRQMLAERVRKSKTAEARASLPGEHSAGGSDDKAE